MKTLRIRPVAGKVVRDPDLRDLLTTPRLVIDTAFWRRRIRDGDVALDESPASAPEAASQAAELSANPTAPAKSASAKRTTEGGQQ
jgi:hypothetical protein